MNVPLLFRALLLAADRHSTQRRKGVDRTPYINHPIEVAALVAESGIDDEEILAAALLHDVLEDTPTGIEEIEALFGSRTARIVRELTDDKGLPAKVRRRKQTERAAGYSREAKIIRIADKISNLRDATDHPPVGWSEEQRDRYLNWAQEVVSVCRGANNALEELFDEELKRARAKRPASPGPL